VTILALLRAWLTKRATASAPPLPRPRPGFVEGSIPPIDIDDSTLVFDASDDEDETIVILRS
jgi:hypothetical protein